jgi:hypothetical protein
MSTPDSQTDSIVLYGLVCILIASATIGILTLLGPVIGNVFSNITTYCGFPA